jgi:magnesium chelatase family protein
MPARDLTDAAGGEPSSAIRSRVIAARDRQMIRDGILNARLHGRRLRAVTVLEEDARRLLDTALTKLSLSARGHDRVLRVARTIADLAASERVGSEHLAEALQFRGD